ncbi:hydroperoxide isomerase ALOXE3-like [Sphaeramia orbicularis]|uniref:Hydroperoxide isomerase ALOXE3-like n=1 Tax=Sphaeramia orbicularis TaxID=375764 RepID=A0A673AAH6_9TELE|nr:hydroperoxide isomerase ALOXE3-like [Sphaeramia orbicularis]
MAEYKLQVTTGSMKKAGTFDHIFVTLIGTNGQSERTDLDNFGLDFMTGQTSTYTIKTDSSLGELLLIKLEKDPNMWLPFEDQWYCSKIVATTPEGDEILFPCYLWMSRGEVVELRGGKAIKVFEETHPLLTEHRQKELTQKKNIFKWKTMEEGLPHHFDNEAGIPAEVSFSDSKLTEIRFTKALTDFELKLRGLFKSMEKWDNIEDIKKIFYFKRTAISDYVTEHWMDDDFYGYQFLNAINPNVIKRCSELPPNFPVTNEMVQPFLEKGSSLKKEIEKGNIFLYDQKMMDGIPPRLHNDEPLHVTPGLCLLYLNKDNKLMPIAIQLQQQPSETNPIFLPSDSETDWLLAKMFIKNADLMEHQSVQHLTKTHFLGETYAVSTLRNLPVIHPIYKLLIPHFRFNLHINIAARKTLFGPTQPFGLSTAGYDGMIELMRRGLSEVTFSSLCLPDDITARGLGSVPNFYYRDDGLRLWDIVNRFVKAMVEFYYPSDDDVRKDSELQDWINEIFTHGVLENKASGFPESFSKVEEVVSFITMVIYRVSAHHAAVNNGQYDYQFFVPNGSLLLLKPPPTTKGQSNMTTVLEAFPTVGVTVSIASLLWVFSEKYTDMVVLGQYPQERFDETEPKEIIKRFQAELSLLSEHITARNSKLDVPYIYLDPAQIENSIAI